MMCAWDSLLGILPPWLRTEVDKQGRDSIQELRLRINAPPELVMGQRILWMKRSVTRDDLSFCINTASRYSPWAATTISQGYITAPGGHRIGLCGEVVCKNGAVSGMRNIRSICIRVAHDISGISRSVDTDSRSILIIGAPGWGKTTLLRDLIRRVGETETVAVVDERGELFPETFSVGKRVDVLTGCAKAAGIEMLLRTMGAARIAVDEITAPEDANALLHAAGCGVGLIATAHASSVVDLKTRPVYRKIWEEKVFDSVVILRPNRSYYEERMR